VLPAAREPNVLSAPTHGAESSSSRSVFPDFHKITRFFTRRRRSSIRQILATRRACRAWSLPGHGTVTRSEGMEPDEDHEYYRPGCCETVAIRGSAVTKQLLIGTHRCNNRACPRCTGLTGADDEPLKEPTATGWIAARARDIVDTLQRNVMLLALAGHRSIQITRAIYRPKAAPNPAEAAAECRAALRAHGVMWGTMVDHPFSQGPLDEGDRKGTTRANLDYSLVRLHQHALGIACGKTTPHTNRGRCPVCKQEDVYLNFQSLGWVSSSPKRGWVKSFGSKREVDFSRNKRIWTKAHNRAAYELEHAGWHGQDQTVRSFGRMMDPTLLPGRQRVSVPNTKTPAGKKVLAAVQRPGEEEIALDPSQEKPVPLLPLYVFDKNGGVVVQSLDPCPTAPTYQGWRVWTWSSLRKRGAVEYREIRTDDWESRLATLIRLA